MVRFRMFTKSIMVERLKQLPIKIKKKNNFKNDMAQN